MRPGIDVLLSDSAHLVRGARVALLTNQAGVDRSGRRTLDRLRAAGVRVEALFSPEHGFRGREDRPNLPDAVDSATGLPIYSLYTGARPPRLAALDSVDAVLIDLQDIGARYYTYVASAALLMREAARHKRRVVVLDRPNPLGGVLMQGNTRADTAPLAELVGVLPVPMRHGMTVAELLSLANDVYAIGARLAPVPVAGWRRDVAFDATSLPWVAPSPNMPSLESAWHYPGTCLFEATNLSVGRGTPIAFQVIGAPWLEPERLLRVVGAVGSGADTGVWRGVELVPHAFTPNGPTDKKYDGVAVRGLRLRVTDRAVYDPTRAAVALLAGLKALHGDSLQILAASFDRLAGSPTLRAALLAGQPARAIWAGWEAALDRFRDRRAKYLLY